MFFKVTIYLYLFLSVLTRAKRKTSLHQKLWKIFFLDCMWIHTKADRPVYVIKDCFFPTVMFLSEVWIGMLVKGSTVKWSQANGLSVTICSLVKYVCYSNKHQSHWNNKKNKTDVTVFEYRAQLSKIKLCPQWDRAATLHPRIITIYLWVPLWKKHDVPQRPTNSTSSVSLPHARLNFKKKTAFRYIFPLIIEHCMALNCVSGWWMPCGGGKENGGGFVGCL